MISLFSSLKWNLKHYFVLTFNQIICILTYYLLHYFFFSLACVNVKLLSKYGIFFYNFKLVYYQFYVIIFTYIYIYIYIFFFSQWIFVNHHILPLNHIIEKNFFIFNQTKKFKKKILSIINQQKLWFFLRQILYNFHIWRQIKNSISQKFNVEISVSHFNSFLFLIPKSLLSVRCPLEQTSYIKFSHDLITSIIWYRTSWTSFRNIYLHWIYWDYLSIQYLVT